jgi:hypothetical protein
MRFPSVPEGQGDTGSTGGHIPVRGDATLLSSHVGRPCYARRAAQRTVATKAISFVERTRRTHDSGHWDLRCKLSALAKLRYWNVLVVGSPVSIRPSLTARGAGRV